MAATVEVRFKGNRKDYFLWPDGAEQLRLSDPVIVPADRGLDFGRVSAVGETATKKCVSGCSGCAVGETRTPEVAVVRRATQDEIRTANDLRRSEEDTRRTVLERVRERKLDMKVSDAEWQFDRKKLTVYFTAEKRVDFRELVRDLASILHTRIDLRQIGARDEAARLSGVGRCGKEYCCSTWLTNLSPVSLALAKDQHLSLNPAQISGGCGRLLCCLKYEHEFYVTARKRFPKEGKALRTGRGIERVVAVDIFRERVFLRSDEQGPRIIALIDLREELERLGEPPPEARGQQPDAAVIARGQGPQSNPAEIATGAPRPRDDAPAGSVRPRDDAPAGSARPRDDTSAGSARPRDDAPPESSRGPGRSDTTSGPRKRRRRRKRKGPGPDGGAPPSPPTSPGS